MLLEKCLNYVSKTPTKTEENNISDEETAAAAASSSDEDSPPPGELDKPIVILYEKRAKKEVKRFNPIEKVNLPNIILRIINTFKRKRKKQKVQKSQLLRAWRCHREKGPHWRI